MTIGHLKTKNIGFFIFILGGVGGLACRIIVSAPVPAPFLWTLDFAFGTWIWDSGLGLGNDNNVFGRYVLILKR